MATMAEDRARYADGHWWWDGRLAKHILAGLLREMEAGGEGARLVAYPGLSEKGVPTLWFRVDNRDTHHPIAEESPRTATEYNQSTFCPPFCG